MSTVRIPPTLRAATGGLKRVEVAGSTIREVLDGLLVAYPTLSAQLVDAAGAPNRFINIFLNDTDVRHLDALDTPVSDADSVVLLPAMAGG